MLGDSGSFHSLVSDQASAKQLPVASPANESLYESGPNVSLFAVTSLACSSFPALCSLHWLAVVIIVEVAFGIGCAVDCETWKDRLKLKIGLAVAAATHFLIKPLLIFAWIKLLNLQYAPVIALLVTISLPGGQLTSLLTFMIDGDRAFSAFLTFAFTLLALIFLPLNLFVYASHWLLTDHVTDDVIAYPSIIFVFLLMMIPLGVGVLISRLRPRVAQAINKVLSLFLVLTLLSFTILALIEEKEKLFHLKPDRIWMAYTLTPIVGIIIGFLVASLLRVDSIACRTLAVDTMTQNCPLAAALLKVVFPSSFIGIFYLLPLLYLLIQFVEALLFVAMMRYKLKRDAEEKENAFFALGGVPVGRIRRISFHTIDKIRRSLTWSRSSEISDPSGSVDNQQEDDDAQEVFATSMRRNNLIQMAIAEEEEMSASSQSRKDNKEKLEKLNKPTSQSEEEELHFEDVRISNSE